VTRYLSNRFVDERQQLKFLVVDELRRKMNDRVQRSHLLHEQFAEPDFDVANTSNWLLQL